MPVVPAFWGQKTVDIYEFKVGLVYITKFYSYIVRPYRKNNLKNDPITFFL